MSLSESVTTAVSKMGWIEPTDQAVAELAKTYARRIDEALESGDGTEATKALYLGPHLLNALKALGGAPLERKELAEAEEVGGKLGELRSLTGGKKPA